MMIHQHTATEIVNKIADGEYSAEDVFKHQQNRIAEVDQNYNAFVHVVESQQDTESNSLLKGLPISVKDQIHVAGMPCTSGYEGLKDFVPEEDAPVIAMLKAQGATILGKTNLPPLAMDFQTYNSLHGQTRNPWNPDYTTGGSSGGSAVAVASGMAFADIGADLAGSLRIPASFCGVYSLMPSVDHLSTQGSSTLLEQANVQLDYLPRLGPMTRSTDDLALLWEALTNERQVSKTSIRLAFLPDDVNLPLHPAIENVIKGLWQALADKQAVQSSVAGADDFDWCKAWQAYGVIQGHQLGAMMPMIQRFIGRFMSRGAAMRRSPNFIKPIQDGYKRNQKAYQQALSVRNQLMQSLDTFLEHYDAWVLPVTLVPAFPHIEASFEQGFVRDYTHEFDIKGQGVNYFEALTRLTTPFNLTGHPVVTMPIGKDDATGVPIGVQLVGKRNHEADLIATASLLSSLIASPQYDI